MAMAGWVSVGLIYIADTDGGMFAQKSFTSFTHHLRWIDLESAAMGDV